MKRTIIYTAALLMSATALAHAQSSTGTAQSGAQAIAISGGSGSGSGTSKINERLTNNPDMSGPVLYSANPCGTETAGAFSGLGFGVSLGHTDELRGCTQRAWFGNLATAAKQFNDPAMYAAAKGIACLNEDVKASSPIGFCPGDTRVPAAVVAQVAAPRPAPSRPQWCENWTTADGNIDRYRAVCVN